MRNIKLWPHGAVIALGCALVAGLGVALYSRYGQNSQAAELPDAARIQRVDGQVAFNDNLTDDNSNWTAAAPNQPFSVGDRIYTRENSRTSLAFSGRNFARLDPNTSLDCVNLSDSRTQLALREGTAIFDVGYLPSGGLFEVGTPYGAVDFQEPGLYQMRLDNGNAIVSVLSGLAQVVGQGAGGRISKGEMLTILGATAAEAALSRLNNRDAGYLVDDYYRYQYPNVYDGRYASYDAYTNDPYYYDPYRRNASYQYVNYTIPGVNDLDNYGDWQQISNYGYAWRPRVDASWVPYQQGSWVNDNHYGLTWVSNEPWGYAPYHYGRWANVNNQWYWVPEGVNARPTYSPALVAFVPLSQSQIGWVPLGPGDAYVPRYYDENWQPHYLTRGDVIAANLVNMAVPNAVTVVPVDAFGRPINPGMVMRVNPQTVAQVRPTLEPLTLTPLRNAVLHSAWGRGKIDLPPGIAKKLYETPVVVGSAPVAPPFRKDLARALRVEPVNEKIKNQKFKVKDGRSIGSAQVEGDGKQQIDVGKEAARENKDARKEVRQIEQQQRKDYQKEQRAQQKVEQKSFPRTQGEQVGNPVKLKPPKVREAAQPQVQGGPPARGAAKHENKQSPGQSQPRGGGKGKGKKP